MEFTSVELVALGAVAAIVVLLAAVLLMLLAQRRHRAEQAVELSRARTEAEELRARVDALAVQVATPTYSHEPEEYVITTLGSEPEPQVPATPERIDARLFADLLMRETVVKAASFGHGVRRALAPETRNRIRFEMKREVKRSRKGRKDEFKRVRAEMRARERRAMQPDGPRVPGQPAEGIR